MKPSIIIGIVIAAVVVLGAAASLGGDDSDEMNITIPADDTLDEFDSINPVDDVNLDCLGTAQCFAGTVTEVIDGDTILVNGESIRFSLSSAPELKGFGGVDSKNFIETLCPVGSTVTVDEDDGQIIGSYGRIIALVYCGDVNLNSELLDANMGHLEERFCDSSEFAGQSWAVKHGC